MSKPDHKRGRLQRLARPFRVEVCAFSKHKECRRQWGHLRTLQFGPPSVSLHTQPQPDACRTSPLSWQGILPGQWALQLERTTPCTHTGAVESITGISVTITRNWLEEGVHDVGCCGRIAGRDKHPIFLVRGSCRVHSVDFQFTFNPVAPSLLALASTEYVKEVTLTS